MCLLMFSEMAEPVLTHSWQKVAMTSVDNLLISSPPLSHVLFLCMVYNHKVIMQHFHVESQEENKRSFVPKLSLPSNTVLMRLWPEHQAFPVHNFTTRLHDHTSSIWRQHITLMFSRNNRFNIVTILVWYASMLTFFNQH